MPERKYMTTRERPHPIRIMASEAEKRELVKAAKKADKPLSTFVREGALEKARREAKQS
jgi:uncharacterized protein (DUF1778 family)